MSPRTLLRIAALNALAQAANLSSANADFLPLVGAQVFLGQSWPSQSPAPGAAPMPNQVLIYLWNEKSETTADKTTAPQFETTVMLVMEARVETRTPAATATLPAAPATAAIAGAVDGLLEALTYAVKEAVCGGVQLAAMTLNGGTPVIEGIKSVEVADKLAESGQRIAGNGVVTFDLSYTETFGQLAPFPPLTDVMIIIGPEAAALADPGNAGNGTISAITLSVGIQAGYYAIAFSSPTAYAVTAPDGTAIGGGVIGTPFDAGGLNFTISASTRAFADGDGFTVLVQPMATTQLNLSA